MAELQNKVRQFTDQIISYIFAYIAKIFDVRIYLLSIYFLINEIANPKIKNFVAVSSGRQLFFWHNEMSANFLNILIVQKGIFHIIRIVEKKLALPIWGWQMSILDVSFQSLVVMIEHGTSLIIEPGVMMRISWHTTPKWTRPMSRSKIQTRCHFLHSSLLWNRRLSVVEFKAKFLNGSLVVFILVWYVMKFSSSHLALLSGMCRVQS